MVRAPPRYKTSRYFFQQVGRKFVILHGYRKQSMKAPEKEIATALRRMQELLEK